MLFFPKVKQNVEKNFWIEYPEIIQRINNKGREFGKSEISRAVHGEGSHWLEPNKYLLRAIWLADLKPDLEPPLNTLSYLYFSCIVPNEVIYLISITENLRSDCSLFPVFLLKG